MLDAPPPDAPAHPELDALIATLERLRAPGGCAWDREQTHASLVQYLVEETYELVEAIESGTREELIEELGDVLYQVLFHADIASEAGSFTLEDVASHMRLKMIARHPHVFGDAVAETADDVVATWDRIKAVEKAHRESVLDGIPDGMPALALADKLLGRAAKVGVTRDPVTVSAAPVSAASVPAAPVPATSAPATPVPATVASTEGPLGEQLLSDQLLSEQLLGEQLLGMVAAARDSGLDAERALRGALRSLRADVRSAEAGGQPTP
ncbi:MAG: MazG family protein [Microbacteriaceae bacterium]|nr:MazG family protein [Microbacteriaceae bacterium]